MRKNLKALALFTITGALIAGTAFAAYAAQAGTGEWAEGESGWWYKLSEDGSQYAHSGWYYIEGEDGVINSYCFDDDGWLIVSSDNGGYEVDASGRYIVDGEAVVYSADEVDYTVAGSLTSELTLQIQDAIAEAESEVTTADLLGLNDETAASASSVNAIKSGGAYSSSDDPENMTATYEFTYSTLSGSTATNSWSKFKITLPGTPTRGADDNTDFYYEEEDIGTIVSSYYRLDKYGSADLASFVAGFIADARGFDPEVKSGGDVSVDGEVSLGGISFTKLTRMDPSPLGTSYKDYCYVRVVNGMVHVLIFDYQGAGEEWSSVLNTISAG